MADQPGTSNVPPNWPSSTTYTRIPVHSTNLSAFELRTLRSPPSATPDLRPLKLHRRPPSHIAILPITAPHHPARGQYGLFATEDLPPGSLVVFYLGLVHGQSDQNDEHGKSDYDLSLVRETVSVPSTSGEGDAQEVVVELGVDGEKVGNEARFVNDYRGVPLDSVQPTRSGGRGSSSSFRSPSSDRPLVPAPNAEFRDVWVEYTQDKETHVERCIAIFVREAGKSGKWKRGIRKGEEILVSYGKGFWGARQSADQA